VNNDSSADSGMTTYAICADKPKKYKVVQSSAVLDGPSGGPITGDAEATCPSKTVVLGGGTDSSSFDLLDNIGLSEPSPDIDYSWYGVQVSENGENPLPTMTTYAICAVQPPGYHIIWSGAVTVPDNTQGNVSVDCPGKAVPISGGGGGGPDLPMFVATLYPSGPQSWKAYVNNLTGSDDESAWAMVICAK